VSQASQFNLMPPHDVQAEKSLIASLILSSVDKNQQRAIARMARQQEFFQADHQTIWGELLGMIEDGTDIDALTLRERLTQRKLFEEVGGIAYLAEIINTVPAYAHAESYAAIVRRTAVQRGGIAVANIILQQMYGGGFDAENPPATAIQKQIEALWRLTQDATAQSFHELRDLLREAVELKRECPAGANVLTGLASIDRYAGIFRQKATTIIAARPSMGKSTMIRWLLSLFAAQGIRCGLVAVEEDGQKVARNYLSALSEIENQKIAAGNLDEQEWGQLTFAQNTASQWPIIICDDCQGAEDVATAIEVLATQYGCGVVATDHIQKLYLRGHWENRNQEMTRISAMLSARHKRLNVCGILASQLGRPEQKHGCPPPPTMATLRESGALEQDADSVLFIHREDYYYKAKTGHVPNHQAKIIVEKNRDGPTGFLTLIEELQYQRFREMTDTERIAHLAGGNQPDEVPVF
jgi:replicative DNA helicase